ncbi:amidohydrolase family protein [Alteribacillus iranensis]|uniref:Cytosine/adenosine deaminase n=1 Tax=Alteribacillus iranensis TaxID=930128 RepID=A0A1I2BDJ2_9BACI|nr:amidohydrolase family protein [Alteribacillus iranensis]SFE54166.1 Cytosine/adenosine deaminase [Alteribacillus iranensis]
MSIFIQNVKMVNDEMEIEEGSIYVENSRIEEIIPGTWQAEYPYNNAREVIRGDNMLVIPGLINAHYHSYSNLFKGTENYFPLEPWTLYTVAYGHALAEEDIKLSVQLGAIEMMKNGITSCLDHFPHISYSEAALQAYEASGMRVSFAPMMHDIPDHQFLPVELPQDILEQLNQSRAPSHREIELFYQELLRNWQDKNQKITIMAAPNAPQRCSTEMLAMCEKLSNEYGLHIHTHLLETKIQQEISEKKLSGSVDYLGRHGLVNSQLTVAHAVWLQERELELLNEANVTIVHNPHSNMILGSGRAPIGKYLRKGISVALGTDASNCGTQHNLFEIMRSTIMLDRIGELDFGKWLHASDVFKMATQYGACAMGKQEHLGQVRQGQLADLVLLDTTNATWTPENDVISQLVFNENGQSVDSVMIGGEWTVKNRKILSIDEEEIIWKVKKQRGELFAKCTSNLSFAEKQLPYYKSMYYSYSN